MKQICKNLFLEWTFMSNFILSIHWSHITVSPAKCPLSLITPLTFPGQRALEFSHCHHQHRMMFSCEAINKDPSVQLLLHPGAQELTASLQYSANIIIFPDMHVEVKNICSLGLTYPPEPANSVQRPDAFQTKVVEGTPSWLRNNRRHRFSWDYFPSLHSCIALVAMMKPLSHQCFSIVNWWGVKKNTDTGTHVKPT